MRTGCPLIVPRRPNYSLSGAPNYSLSGALPRVHDLPDILATEGIFWRCHRAGTGETKARLRTEARCEACKWSGESRHAATTITLLCIDSHELQFGKMHDRRATRSASCKACRMGEGPSRRMAGGPGPLRAPVLKERVQGVRGASMCEHSAREARAKSAGHRTAPVLSIPEPPASASEAKVHIAAFTHWRQVCRRPALFARAPLPRCYPADDQRRSPRASSKSKEAVWHCAPGATSRKLSLKSGFCPSGARRGAAGAWDGCRRQRTML